jgi:hypothetical protein
MIRIARPDTQNTKGAFGLLHFSTRNLFTGAWPPVAGVVNNLSQTEETTRFGRGFLSARHLSTAGISVNNPVRKFMLLPAKYLIE